MVQQLLLSINDDWDNLSALNQRVGDQGKQPWFSHEANQSVKTTNTDKTGKKQCINCG